MSSPSPKADKPSSPPLPDPFRELADQRLVDFRARAEETGIEVPDPEQWPGEVRRVWSCSDYVAKTCTRHPALLGELLGSGDLARRYDGDDGVDPTLRKRVETAVSESENEEQLARRLRELRHREMVRIAWRDLGALADLEETVRDTSWVADTIIQTTLQRLHAWQCASLGEPVDEAGTVQQLVVFGLGKLGASELNFSSDIDLIFAFAQSGTVRGGRKGLSNEEYFKRLGRRLIQVLSERTPEGIVFRVDMRLRPFGASGPLVMSFNAMVDYYQTHGREWERYALVRARPVGGDLSQGAALLERLRPFVYRRYLDFGALESMRDMKRLITDEVSRKGLEGNVKLGSGGIREIEFTGQAFQMVRGGRIPALRDRSILKVIGELGRRGFLPPFAVSELTEAYRFLRTAEHRLQQVDDRQTHTLPTDEAGRSRLAAGMGLAGWSDFSDRLERHRRHVTAHFDQVLGPPAAPIEEVPDPVTPLWTGSLEGEDAVATLAGAGYDQPEQARDRLLRFKEAYAIRLLDQRGRERLNRLMPDLVRAVATQPNPVVTLGRVLQIVESIARRSVYVALLCERPLALSQLVRLCAASPWIAREMGRHPGLFDELLDPRNLYAPLDRAALAHDLGARLGNVAPGDTEQEMEYLRQFKHASVLRVAAADVAKALPLMVVSDHLTEIAEATLSQVLALAWRDLVARYGEPRNGDGETVPFAVIAYGKLGGIELGYASDLDLVFVHASHDQTRRTSGPKVVDNAMFFARLGQRIIHFLTTPTAEGVLYEVDPRLRPSGSKGLLVNSFDALAAYLRNEAWTWEHQALVRARVVAGDEGLRQRFAELRREVLLMERDPVTLRREVREMRDRMRSELGSGSGPGLDLKQDPGGIADIEFMVQYGVLRWASRLGDYLRFTDNIRLLEGFVRAELLPAGDVRLLIDAYRAYRARSHELALQGDERRLGEDEFVEYREAVLRIWQRLMEGEEGTPARARINRGEHGHGNG